MLRKFEELIQETVDFYNQAERPFHCYATWSETSAPTLNALRLAGHVMGVRKGIIAEVGTETGLSSLIMALVSGTKVYSCDLRKECVDYAQERAKRHGLDVTYVHGDVKALVKAMGERPIELAYIDGGHRTEDALYDLTTLAPYFRPNGYMICDDIAGHNPECLPSVDEAIAQFLETHGDWNYYISPCMFGVLKKR